MRLSGIAGFVVVASLVMAAPAAAYDAYPCGPPFGGPAWRQYCPDWSPNNSIPVFYRPAVGERIVGYIYAPGDDWYYCQHQAGRFTMGGYWNTWWAGNEGRQRRDWLGAGDVLRRRGQQRARREPPLLLLTADEPLARPFQIAED